MKKTIIKISALSISLMILATSCSKGPTGPAGSNGPAGANGSTGPNLIGNLQGVVSLYDFFGGKIVSASIQTNDTLMLTNNTTNAILTTTTSSTGAYSFNNITTGTYSMKVLKYGYGTVLTNGIQFAGGGSADRNYALSAYPAVGSMITGATAVDTNYAVSGIGSANENYVKVRGTIAIPSAGNTEGCKVIVYISNAGSTTVSSASGSFSNYYTYTIPAGKLNFTISIPTSALYSLGFPAGSPTTNYVYFAAYIVGGNLSASYYVDLNGQPVFTALSPAYAGTISAGVQ